MNDQACTSLNDQACTSLTAMPGCPYCSSQWQQIYHGGACPKVRAIEYHPNGTIKRVEFNVPAPFFSAQWRTVPDDFQGKP